MRDNEKRYVENVVPLRETDKALMVWVDEETEHWIPKSLIDDESEVYSMKSGAAIRAAFERSVVEADLHAELIAGESL